MRTLRYGSRVVPVLVAGLFASIASSPLVARPFQAAGKTICSSSNANAPSAPLISQFCNNGSVDVDAYLYADFDCDEADEGCKAYFYGFIVGGSDILTLNGTCGQSNRKTVHFWSYGLAPGTNYGFYYMIDSDEDYHEVMAMFTTITCS